MPKPPTPRRGTQLRRLITRLAVVPKRGQAMVEFALVLMIVVMVLLLTIDLGRAYFTYAGLRNAAREAAIYGGYNPRENCSTGSAYAGLRYSASKELGQPYANVVCTGGSGDNVIIDTTSSNRSGCFQWTAPSTYTPCPASLNPTMTYVYRVSLVTNFAPVSPLVGLLTGNGFGARVPITTVHSSPVLAGYE